MSDIASILNNSKTIAVVGLSPKTHRDSYRVASYMQSHGYRIVPINPAAQEVLGERSYGSLLEAAQHVSIDLVNCFRRSEDIPAIFKESLDLKIPSFWLQIGIERDDCAAEALKNNMSFVQNRCLMVEHRIWQSSNERK
jgi:uncharacterized protein